MKSAEEDIPIQLTNHPTSNQAKNQMNSKLNDQATSDELILNANNILNGHSYENTSFIQAQKSIEIK